MNSTRKAARQAGLLYLLFSILAVIGEFLFPTFTVHGDAAATARNITGAEPMYRLSILNGFATLLMFIFVVLSLYDLLKGVDRKQARLMLLLVAVGVALALGNMLKKFAPLVLLSGADYLAVFSRPQLEALALASLRWHASGVPVVNAFWGLWLLPFGILVIKSRLFPRILGILLIVAGSAYIASSFTSLVLPDYRAAVNRIAMPLYFGEVPIILWLVIKGAREPQPDERSPGQSQA